jgi:hypothetical protein
MKKSLLGIALAACCTFAWGAPVTVSGVATNGNGSSVNNAPALIVDGVVPAEGNVWNGASSVWWRGLGKDLTLTFDQEYELGDALVSVDNNDSYRVFVSRDNISWNALFTIWSGDGEIGSGMDTMSSEAGHAEYVEGIYFAPTLARYARIQAIGGDNSYAVAELSFQGTPARSVAAVQAIPEPGSLALMATGLALGGFIRYRGRAG